MSTVDSANQNALHGLAEPGFTPHTFFSYLILQILVLLAWWPMGGLFDRIDAAAEPVTLTAVCIFTGAALAYFALQLSADEQSGLHARWISPPGADQPQHSTPTLLVNYFKIHALQLGYLIVLCTPVVVIAHAISSVPLIHLLWIVAITALHTTFYRLLGSWLHLLWAAQDMLATVVSRMLMAVVYLTTTFLVPVLSHISVSFQLTQPLTAVDAPPVKMVMSFIATYTAVCIVLAILLSARLNRVTGSHRSKQLVPRSSNQSAANTVDPGADQ